MIQLLGISFVSLFVLIMTLYALAHISTFRMLRPVYCRVLPWHSRNYEKIGHDGCSTHARCRWCGYEGKIDSQGNLF